MRHKGGWIAAVVLIVVVAAAGAWAYSSAHRFESLARAGKADASAAVKNLSAKDIAAANASFTKAGDEFSQARDLLGPGWLHDVPWLGRQLAAADDLATIGLEGSSAGLQVTALLSEAPSVTGDNRLTQLLQVARPRIDSALSSLAVVAQRSAALTPDGLVPPLADAVTQAREELEPMSLLLSRSQSMLAVERYLFSAQHRFLVVSQNSAELRPTGGFMGTFGLVEFGPDGFNLTRFSDIYTLPGDTLNLPLPEGGQVNHKHFYFRNANWWMDFPTSAGVMLRFWQNMQQQPVDGIIAIDIPTIRDLLKVFGPIAVPESKVALTADNVLEQLTYVVEYENGRAGADKKNAVASLASELINRVLLLTDAQLAPTLEALSTSANEKHVQVWFAEQPVQAAMVGIGWSGALDPPADTTDLLAVSNGVIKPSKANLGVTKKLDYRVSLGADGTADTTLELGFTKSSLKLLGVPQQWLADYARVHRLAGTTQAAGESGATFDALSDATGLPTFGHYFRLDRGASTGFSLHTLVPRAMRQGTAMPLPGLPATSGDAGTWHYRLLVAKQADLADTSLTVTVTMPAGGRVAGAAAWFRATGAKVATTADGTTVTMTTPLKQDVVLDVTVARG